jgi:hypothetical protein
MKSLKDAFRQTQNALLEEFGMSDTAVEIFSRNPVREGLRKSILVITSPIEFVANYFGKSVWNPETSEYI